MLRLIQFIFPLLFSNGSEKWGANIDITSLDKICPDAKLTVVKINDGGNEESLPVEVIFESKKANTAAEYIYICDLEYEKGASPHFNHFEICNKIAKKLKARRIPFLLLNILRDMLPFI